MDEVWTREILSRVNAGTLQAPPVEVAGFPVPDGDQVLDLRRPDAAVFSVAQAKRVFAEFLPSVSPNVWGTPVQAGLVRIDPGWLEELGLAVAPYTAFGLLNGGMATTYADRKKNSAFAPELYEAFRPTFEALAQAAEGQPKGLTAAFVQRDLQPGPSYLELKLRHLAQINFVCRQKNLPGPGLQLFQMTSEATDPAIRSSWSVLSESPVLSDLLDLLPLALEQTPTAMQELIGALTSAKDGLPRRLFTTTSQGREEIYTLPGGHGQSFRVLEPIYRDLERRGYRFAYLGNIDNLGFLPSLRSLALMALGDHDAGFDFSFKTPLDVKGGVLYRQPDGRLNCADIGVAMDSALVAEAEARGTPILFNCATGVFNLNRLIPDLERIMNHLPVRISEQDKDVGRYAQAEQVTWEVLGLLSKPVVFGIEKSERFLAAKMLMDCLLTSGIVLDRHERSLPSWRPYVETSQSLYAGLTRLLGGALGFQAVDKRWEPLSRARLEASLSQDWRRLSV